MLLRRLIPLALLPFTAFTHAACTLTDPTLTLQSYTVNPQQERIVMYWQKQNGKAWGSLRSLLSDIDKDGSVQMAMNGGIYDKAYEPLGLYIENGELLKPLNRASGGGNFFIRPGGVFWLKGQRAGITPINNFKPSPEITYAVQSGPMLIENGAINWRLKPSASSRKLRNGVGIDKQDGWYLCLASVKPISTISPVTRSPNSTCARCSTSTAPSQKCIKRAAAYRGSTIRSSP